MGEEGKMSIKAITGINTETMTLLLIPLMPAFMRIL
jgi:hypothetical protein